MSIQDNLPISGLTCWIGGGVCRSAVRSTGSKPDLGEGWEIPKLKPHALASQNDRTLGNQGWAGSTHAERVPVLLASFCCVLPETPPPPNPQLKSKHLPTSLPNQPCHRLQIIQTAGALVLLRSLIHSFSFFAAGGIRAVSSFYLFIIKILPLPKCVLAAFPFLQPV